MNTQIVDVSLQELNIWYPIFFSLQFNDEYSKCWCLSARTDQSTTEYLIWEHAMHYTLQGNLSGGFESAIACKIIHRLLATTSPSGATGNNFVGHRRFTFLYIELLWGGDPMRRILDLGGLWELWELLSRRLEATLSVHRNSTNTDEIQIHVHIKCRYEQIHLQIHIQIPRECWMAIGYVGGGSYWAGGGRPRWVITATQQIQMKYRYMFTYKYRYKYIYKDTYRYLKNVGLLLAR